MLWWQQRRKEEEEGHVYWKTLGGAGREAGNDSGEMMEGFGREADCVGGDVSNGYTRLFYKAIRLATIVQLMEREILNMAFRPRRLQTARCSAETDSQA